MRVLVSPLDWGLGHATRCIPIIRALRASGHEVIIAASGAGRLLLQGEFPELESEEFPSYAMRYSKSRFLLPFWLLAQLPPFLLSILREQRQLDRLIRTRGIDRVISDGRYGIRTRKVPCVFITHQLCILPPGPRWLRALLTGPLLRLNRFVLRGFIEIWVPDFPGSVNLSGKLGHPGFTWPKVRYIFPLCRFRPEALPWTLPVESGEAGFRVDALALVSGPEPQRTVFENLLTEALRKRPGTRVLVRGIPGTSSGQRHASQHVVEGELNVFDHLPGEQLSRFLAAASHVVCRSGYTSVMELAGMGKRNVLCVPTPGQPEQEYLAVHLSAMGLAACQKQEHLDVEAGLLRAEGLSGFAALFHAGDSVSRSPHSWDLSDWMREHPLFHDPEHVVKRLAGKFVL